MPVKPTTPPPLFYQIAVPSPLRRRFDYLPPTNSDAPLTDGVRVTVPFGRRQVVGVIVGSSGSSDYPAAKLRPILAVLDEEPLLPPSLFQLFLWAADYYQHPVGEALAAALPTLLRRGERPPNAAELRWQLTTHGRGLPADALRRAPRQQQLLQLLQAGSATADHITAAGVNRDAVRALLKKSLIEQIEVLASATPLDTPEKLLAEDHLSLYPDQRAALDALELHGYHSYLLQGETGSGKTEVYLQAIEKVLRYGRQALVLVPEISLTPQTLQRFRARFAVPVAALHSGLTDRERLHAWNDARTGRAGIVVGTRSAVFTPLLRPGIIIVDEEHDPSFKQQEGFRYSARDVAVMRASREAIPVVLGTATPSLESLHNCHLGRYTQLRLRGRPGGARLPTWQLLDLRRAPLQTGFTAPLIAAIGRELKAGNQVLVFLNRRGFAPTLMCHDCGWTACCTRCDVRLTVHRSQRALLCHHCEHREPIPNQCPTCHSPQLLCLGQGTQRSEESLSALFPDVPVLRVDRDSTRAKQAMSSLAEQVNSGAPCILVGTQILAKGHHFPGVTLVAILDADSGLFSADFRATERMGQLIIQVAGRAGRGDRPGTVILQSHHCEHPLIAALTQSGYPAFAAMLMAQRSAAKLPPLRNMALLRAEAHQPEDALNLLHVCRRYCEQQLPAGESRQYSGPWPAPLEKQRGRYRFQFVIGNDDRGELQRLLTGLATHLEQQPGARKARWSVDVDPQDML